MRVSADFLLYFMPLMTLRVGLQIFGAKLRTNSCEEKTVCIYVWRALCVDNMPQDIPWDVTWQISIRIG